MKVIKVLSLIVCAASLLLTGCKSASCCAAGSADKAGCGMACCADAKTDCASCPTCSAKK